MLRFKCPRCDKVLGVKEQLAGKKVACPHCKAPFTVPAPKAGVAVDGDGTGARAPAALGAVAGTAAPPRQPPVRVTFPCPHCHEKLKIPLDLAGKQRPCPRCKKPLTIPPVDELKALAAAPAAAGGAAGVDLEDLAASALAGPTTTPEEVAKEQKKIDVTCPWCDEKVQFDADLAGKQAQCPECKNIVKVPVPKEEKPKDWRDVQKRGPSLAVDSQTPVLENAWGTATDRGVVHRKSMEEAGVIVAEAEPIRPTIWIRRVLVTVLVIGFGVIVYFAALRSQLATREKNALKDAEDAFETVKQGMPRGKAALFHLGAGEFLARKDEEGIVEEARKQFNAVRGQYVATQVKTPLTLEDDLLLVDLALLQLELGGDEDQAIHKKKLRWPDVLKDLDRTLGLINSPEAKVMALRKVSLKLQDLKQEGIALSLAAQVHAAAGGDKEEVKNLLQAEQVALLMIAKETNRAKDLLPQPDPAAKDAGVGKGARLAYATAAAYDGNFELARQIAQMKGAAVDKLQAHLAVAEIALTKKKPDEAKGVLDDAMKVATDELKKKAPALLLYQLTSLSARVGATEEAETWLKHITDAGAKARAQLEILKAQAAKSGQPLEPAQMENTKALAYVQAILENARHKAKLGGDVSSVGSVPDEALRPFVQLGIALGTQERNLGK